MKRKDTEELQKLAGTAHLDESVVDRSPVEGAPVEGALVEGALVEGALVEGVLGECPDILSRAISAELDGELAGANFIDGLSREAYASLLEELRSSPLAAQERAQFELARDCVKEAVAAHELAPGVALDIWSAIGAEIEADCALKRAALAEQAAASISSSVQGRTPIAGAPVARGRDFFKELRQRLASRIAARALMPIAAAACAVLAIAVVRGRVVAPELNSNPEAALQVAAISRFDSTEQTASTKQVFADSAAANVVPSRSTDRVADVTFVGIGRSASTSALDREFPGQISGGPFELVDEDHDQLSTPMNARAHERFTDGQTRIQSVFTKPSGEIEYFGRTTPWERNSKMLRVGGVDIDSLQGAGPVKIVPAYRRSRPPVIWVGRLAVPHSRVESSAQSSGALPNG